MTASIGLDDLAALYAQVDPIVATLPDEVREEVQPFRIAFRHHQLGSTIPEALRDARKYFPAAKKAIDEYLLLATTEAPANPATEMTETIEVATPVVSGDEDTSMPSAVPAVAVIDPPAVAGYPDHPAAAIFPMMDEDDLAKLAADIGENGLLEPVVLFEGRVVDGRNRQRACLMAGVAPTYTAWSGTGSIVQWVLSRNLHRRHLTDQQRAIVGGRAKEAFTAEAEERRLANLRQNTDSTESAELRSRGGASGKSAAKAAAALRVSTRAVEQASRVVRSGDQALVQAVERGEVSLDAASIVARLPAEEQRQLVEAGEVKSAAAQMRKKRAPKVVDEPVVTPAHRPDDLQEPPAESPDEEATPEESIPDDESNADDAPTSRLFYRGHPAFGDVATALKALVAQVEVIRARLPDLPYLRLGRLLNELLAGSSGATPDVAAATTTNAMIEEADVFDGISAILHNDLPPVGQNPKADAFRVKIERHLDRGKPLTRAWLVKQEFEADDIVHPSDEE